MSTITRRTASPRVADIWGLSLSAMRQQKVRTALTIIGVVVGTFALVVSLSVGRGVDRAIVNLFHEDDRLRKILVSPLFVESAEDVPAERREPKGAMSEAKRARLRKALLRNWYGVRKVRTKLDPDGIRKLAALEHVASARPVVHMGDKAILDGKAEDVSGSSVEPETRYFRDRLIAGRLFKPDDGRAAIVHEYLLYRWGLSRDEDADAALGRTFRLEIRPRPPDTFDVTEILSRGDRAIGEKEKRALDSALKRLAVLVRFLPMPRDERDVLGELFKRISTTSGKIPPKPIVEEFTIVGILRERDEKDRDPPPFGGFGVWNDDILLPTPAAAEFVLRMPEMVKEGFGSVIITVDRAEAVKDVARTIEKMGYGQFSLAEFIDAVRLNVLLVSIATAFVAAVALIVAAIGITNTMIMSVLERTHEIGIMKALGARDRHIRLIFLVEGVLLGLIGSGMGLLLGWLASFPGDAVTKQIMEPQTRTPINESIFVYPIWLVLGVPALVCLITTVAALYPAYRAARVDPVTSLRHE
jgi:putative ABC transport system permease protein